MRRMLPADFEVLFESMVQVHIFILKDRLETWRNSICHAMHPRLDASNTLTVHLGGETVLCVLNLVDLVK